MKIELFFVCFKKHGELQHAVAGPFIDFEAAETAREDAVNKTGGYFVIAKSYIDVKEEEF